MSEPNAPTISGHKVRWAPVQAVALALAAVFLLVGVLGFIPGITTDYGSLSWAGHHSNAKLFDVFNVSVLHNLFHLVFGVAGLVSMRSFNAARVFLIGGGVIYAALWIYGILVDRDSAANVLPINTADNWLHLALAVGMLFLGVAFGRSRPGDRPQGGISTGVRIYKG